MYSDRGRNLCLGLNVPVLMDFSVLPSLMGGGPDLWWGHGILPGFLYSDFTFLGLDLVYEDSSCW